MRDIEIVCTPKRERDSRLEMWIHAAHWMRWGGDRRRSWVAERRSTTCMVPPQSGHLSRKLCLRDSCRDLEAGLKHGIELVKYTSDIASQALPLTLLERRDGEAELELERVLGVEVPTTVTSHDFQLAINGLDDIGGGQRTTNGFWTVEKGQVVQAFLA